MENKMIWSTLVHLGNNMWNEEGNYRGRGENRSNRCASPVLRFDRELWDKYMQKLKETGTDTIILDVGEAMRYESHPELAVEGSWTHAEMKAELEKLNGMGFEVIPKLNFSATHDIGLKDYSKMLSTPIYYQVCKDLIEEVCEVFKPKHFHLGMDEETAEHQYNLDYVVLRQYDLWWHDLYYLVDLVEKHNARAWVWSDYAWNHPDEYVAKMPKSVVQNVWYYRNVFDLNASEDVKRRLRPIELLEKHGFDQVPTGSNFTCYENMELLVKYCKERISPEHLLGFMQTTWEDAREPWFTDKLLPAADALNDARKWFEAN